jgi:hypothetical protein
MAESLLHASVVLSNEQYQLLRSIHPMYTVPKEIGVITFLGVDNVHKGTVHLLIRFEPSLVSDVAMLTKVVERLFGQKYDLAFGNDLGMLGFDPLRVIITTKLQEPLRNPDQYLRKKAQAFVREIVKWRQEQIRRHRQEEDEHWQSFKFNLPEQA